MSKQYVPHHIANFIKGIFIGLLFKRKLQASVPQLSSCYLLIVLLHFFPGFPTSKFFFGQFSLLTKHLTAVSSPSPKSTHEDSTAFEIYVCMYVCMFIYIYIYAYKHMHIYIYIYMYVFKTNSSF